ncbi:hypothetical protein [Tateyamaria sp. ANG-S1]|uniref:hypothetical protein n=1 Tax=Tateyamaria sp. ANG-S1 TaxID=1577905 RepID=UPI00057F5CC0|nr:hypothetical protein [Tateyamaria sp. ANG-S1]KIC49111.1 hypothetical protein RA29_15975 [Tateyamaria sp. ANG-S1]
MTLITPEAEEARSEELVSSMQDTLKTMRKQFKAFIEEAGAGEDLKETEVNKQLAALTRTVANLEGMEKKLDEFRQARSGIAQNGYALNLDFARAEVRCALGRLRACGGTGAVSE